MKKRLPALLLAAAMVCTLAACDQYSGTSTAKSLTGSGEGTGFGGAIQVNVTLSADKRVIEAIRVTESSETDGIGGRAIQLLTDSILEHQTVNLDAISGATLASQGFLSAVTTAIQNAGGSVSSFQTPVPAGVSTPQAPEVDVVIVGAGSAGMTAGITAARAGKKVVILEKAPMSGGNSVRASGGMNAANTPYQNDNSFGQFEANLLERTLSSAAHGQPQLVGLAAVVQKEYDNWVAAGSEKYFDSVGLFILDTMMDGENGNDSDLVATLASNSASAIEWLDSIGAPLPAVHLVDGSSVKRLHRPVGSQGQVLPVGSYLIPRLEQACIDNGVEILFNTPVTEILTAGGTVVGVKAEGCTVSAKAVILATGGFGGNLDMVTQQRPDLEGFATASADGITGDGIRMAQALGAATVDMEQIQLHPTLEQKTFEPIAESLRREGSILVNSQGQRFCHELDSDDSLAAAILSQPGGYAWLLLDQRLADNSDICKEYIAKGLTLQATTWAGLAKAMGVPADALSETVDNWNKAVTAGVDPDFGRPPFVTLSDTASFCYAIKVAPGIVHTMGGVKINTDAQVLDTSGSAIPGLFAAGEVTGGIQGAHRLDGNAVTDCVVFGRIAGERAAAYAE